MKDRPHVTTAPGTLTHRGTTHPLIVMSRPYPSRRMCARQISAKMPVAIAVKGFMLDFLHPDPLSLEGRGQG